MASMSARARAAAFVVATSFFVNATNHEPGVT
jgi:hypothetical protein